MALRGQLCPCAMGVLNSYLDQVLAVEVSESTRPVRPDSMGGWPHRHGFGRRPGQSNQIVFIWVRSYPTVSGLPLMLGSKAVKLSVILVKFNDRDSIGMSPPLLIE